MLAATGIGVGHYLAVGAILFTLGVFGIFLNRKNIIVILMSVELILLAVNINLVSFSAFLNDIVGQVFALDDDRSVRQMRELLAVRLEALGLVLAIGQLDLVAIGKHDQRQHAADIALATGPEGHRLEDDFVTRQSPADAVHSLCSPDGAALHHDGEPQDD